MNSCCADAAPLNSRFTFSSPQSASYYVDRNVAPRIIETGRKHLESWTPISRQDM